MSKRNARRDMPTAHPSPSASPCVAQLALRPQPTHMSSTNLDTAATTSPAVPAKRHADQRLSPRLKQACDLLASGECRTIKAAAERVGLSREHLGRMLDRPHVQAFLTRDARKTIAMGIARASRRMVELVDASSEHVSLDAAKHVLAIEGIKPASDRQVAVNVGLSVGYVIDLSDKPAGLSGQLLTASYTDSTTNPLISQQLVPTGGEE